MVFEIFTPRLLLRKLSKDDSPAMFDYRSDPEVVRYQNWDVRSIREIDDFIEEQSHIDPDTPGTWFQLAIVLKDGNQLIGDCGIHFFPDNILQAEIGCSLSPKFQGRGFASEALESVFSFLFETLGKHRVTASADSRNKASIELMERIGMRREAHFRLSYWCKGEWTDDIIYAMLDEDWNNRVRQVQKGGDHD